MTTGARQRTALALALPYDPAGNPFKMIKAMDVAG